MNLNQVTLPALDIEKSIAFYKSLGLNQIVSAPHYARFEMPEGDSTLSLHLHEGELGEQVIVTYFEISNLDEVVNALESKGVAFESRPHDQTWLWREAYIRDPSDNRICLFHAGENRKNPPWRICD